VKIFVNEANAIYIFREKIEIKALKIAKTLLLLLLLFIFGENSMGLCEKLFIYLYKGTRWEKNLYPFRALSALYLFKKL